MTILHFLALIRLGKMPGNYLFDICVVAVFFVWLIAILAPSLCIFRKII